MANALKGTAFKLAGQKNLYTGKVRDVYNIDDEYLVMVVSDRISAFDVVLPRGIPYKGQVLNQIASKFLDATADIVPNWKISSPDPNVTVGHMCEPYKLEMVIRGYLTGHAWREYRSGKRSLCGVPLPEGMRENQKFPGAIILPNFEYLSNWAENQKIKYTNPKELIRMPKVVKHIDKEINRLNKNLGKPQQIKEFRLVHDNWSVPTGELSPTMKIRRKVVAKKYEKLTRSIYQPTKRKRVRRSRNKSGTGSRP